LIIRMPAPQLPTSDHAEREQTVPRSERGDWTWELVTQFPRQGEWTEEQYLNLDNHQLVEFDAGVLEFLPMPSAAHQWILGFLYQLLHAWSAQHQRPRPLFAPIPVSIRTSKYREPDLLLPRHTPAPDDRDISTPVLVLEIVSPDAKSQRRDHTEKRRDYAQAGIPEYWIVDPETETIIVLTLPEGQHEYLTHGEFRPGQTATSKLLEGFTVDVTACFAAGKGIA